MENDEAPPPDEALPRDAARDKPLSPAAVRALKEAEDRRRQATQDTSSGPLEKDGPSGEEPTRYGDWERKGVAYDF